MLILHTKDRQDGSRRFLFEPEAVNLYDERGVRLMPMDLGNNQAPSFTGQPSKLREIRLLLGQRCNMRCAYCSQEYNHGIDMEPCPSRLDDLIKNISALINRAGADQVKIQFWGGEPLLYFDLIKEITGRFEKQRLAENKLQFHSISNGTLFNPEIADYFLKHRIGITISHDGPGQHLRGVDPLAEGSKSREAILKQHHDSNGELVNFTATFTSACKSYEEVVAYFQNLGEAENKALVFITPLIIHDRRCAENTPDRDNLFLHGDLYFKALLNPAIFPFIAESGPLMPLFFYELSQERDSDIAQPFCPYGRPDSISLDLAGNLHACANGSGFSGLPSESHTKLGHISQISASGDLSKPLYNGWKDRPGCANCPVLFWCRGGCPLSDPEWKEADCKARFTRLLGALNAAVYSITGTLLTFVEGDFKYTNAGHLAI